MYRLADDVNGQWSIVNQCCLLKKISLKEKEEAKTPGLSFTFFAPYLFLCVFAWNNVE
jgi:hypothetical protein